MNLLDTLDNPSMLHAAIVHFPIVLFFACTVASASALAFQRLFSLRLGIRAVSGSYRLMHCCGSEWREGLWRGAGRAFTGGLGSDPRA